MDTQKKLKDIFKRYLANECTPAEIEFLFIHFGTENRQYLDQLVLDEFEQVENEKEDLPALPNHVYEEIKKRIQVPEKKIIKRLWPRIVAAASIIVVLGAGLYFLRSDTPVANGVQQTSTLENDIAPGNNTATLTLSNGEVINLSKAKEGLKIDANKLSYNDGTAVMPEGADDFSHLGGMTIATPEGGQYQVRLPDGTDVWLNAASSITYSIEHTPRALRRVKLEGEAYFEVSKHKKYPFVVSSKGQEVEVLGTHFNINSYPDEMETKTTLLEGSVKVSQYVNGSAKRDGVGIVHLIPGQQSALKAGELTVKEANVENAVAWKNGLLMFNDESLETVMRKISRWYGVRVSIKQEALAQQGVYGTISKYSNLSKVLDMLELAGDMHFELKNNTVTVSKK